MQATSIGDALFTKTQQKVLGLLFSKPEKSFYTNEIMRWASIGRGTVGRELEKLVSAGLLNVTREGNQNHYQANSECPIYEELLSITRKTFGIADVLKRVLEPMKADISSAFIYGSIAKGTDKAKSDIDLMIVGGNLSYSDIMALLGSAENELGRTISPTIYSDAEFLKKLGEKNSFLTRVMQQEQIQLIGSKDDIRTTG